MRGLVVTLTFDFLIIKSNRFIFTEFVNWRNSNERFVRYRIHELFVTCLITDAPTDGP